MSTILITGGTGTLGRDLVAEFRSRKIEPIILSRHAGENRRVADLESGEGLDVALEGIDTVVHLAAGKHQERETSNLASAAKKAGVSHLVFISIVGIDKIPFPYYVAKLAAEKVVTEGEIPFTIFRTVQFHQFAIMLFEAQRLSPVLFAPSLRIQPIDTRVVAARLADLATAAPAGRVPDLGGPEVFTGKEIASLLKKTRGWNRPIVGFSLFGKAWAGYAAGYNLAPDARSGGRTFAEYLEDTK